MVPPSVTSVRVTSMLLVTFWLPTFSTVTSTSTMSPSTAEPGALTLVMAMSVVGWGTRFSCFLVMKGR